MSIVVLLLHCVNDNGMLGDLPNVYKIQSGVGIFHQYKVI